MAEDKEAIVRAEALDLNSSNATVDKVFGPPGKKRFRHEPVTISGISVVSSVWLLIILAVSGGLIVSFVFPSWVTIDSVRVNRDLVVENVYIGLFRYCRDDRNGTQQCERYDVSNDDPLAPDSLNDVQAFFAACVIYGSGCGLLLISFLIGVVAYLKPRISGVSVFLIAFFVQLIAGKKNSIQVCRWHDCFISQLFCWWLDYSSFLLDLIHLLLSNSAANNMLVFTTRGPVTSAGPTLLPWLQQLLPCISHHLLYSRWTCQMASQHTCVAKN